MVYMMSLVKARISSLRFWWEQVEIYSSCGPPTPSFQCQFSCLLNLPPSNLEWPASFFGLSLPSGYGASFKLHPTRKFLRLLLTVSMKLRYKEQKQFHAWECIQGFEPLFLFMDSVLAQRNLLPFQHTPPCLCIAQPTHQSWALRILYLDMLYSNMLCIIFLKAHIDYLLFKVLPIFPVLPFTSLH